MLLKDASDAVGRVVATRSTVSATRRNSALEQLQLFDLVV